VKEKDTQEELTESVESQRVVIQGVLNKGEEGLSSKDQIQRRRVQRCNKRRKSNSHKSKDKFLGNFADQERVKQQQVCVVGGSYNHKTIGSKSYN